MIQFNMPWEFGFPLKPNESIAIDKHYRSQTMGGMGINISIRLDKHNSTAPHNSVINT